MEKDEVKKLCQRPLLVQIYQRFKLCLEERLNAIAPSDQSRLLDKCETKLLLYHLARS